MNGYCEKLRDPRWQRKRLGVLERAGWACQACRDTTQTLEVHHLRYGPGEPWEVPDEWLECLCEHCHDLRQRLDRCVKKKRPLLPSRKVFEVAAESVLKESPHFLRALVAQAVEILEKFPEV